MPGTFARHFLKSSTPALCSCCAGPWLGLPARSTIFFFGSSAARTTFVCMKKAAPRASAAVVNRRDFFINGNGGKMENKTQMHGEGKTIDKKTDAAGLS